MSEGGIIQMMKRLIAWLREELEYVRCPVCGSYVFTNRWEEGHVPYISIELRNVNGSLVSYVKLGFRCPKASNPVILIEAPLSDLSETVSSSNGDTRVLPS